MTDLDKMIEAVEGGVFLVDMIPHEVIACKAFSGSLDAAKALHEALLPGWEWWRTERGLFGVGIGFEEQFGRSYNPARAWLIAILKAYKSQQEKNQ